jgi:2-amino-4-hydroxy-6-hydroxymethyldihydropteridine diphosphokinase
MSRETVFIGFGSNLGNRVDFCDRAVTLIGLLPNSRLLAVSSLYETEPVADAGAPGDGWFLNGVVQIETDITPQSLHTVCREIEKALGRDPGHRSGPRTMDLDILFYRDWTIREAQLTVPHPRLHLRRFVLEPLVELEPTLVHPVLRQTVSHLRAQLTDRHQVRRLDPQPNTRYGSRPTCSAKAERIAG